MDEANEALQDVAQQISYIGLTKEEINTLFSQTEAEATMQKSIDRSQIKSDLDKIKGLIIDVKPSTSSATNTDISIDLSNMLNFDLSSTGLDVSTLFNTQSNTTSITNQRGEQLYKTAAAKCKASVLNKCQQNNANISIIINSYDMQIDQACQAYERALNKQNQELTRTVQNAKNLLQRARLMTQQQKNQYDMRGCLNALDSCIQDDMVCGTDYKYCLDPTGKYIADGKVVIGSTPGFETNWAPNILTKHYLKHGIMTMAQSMHGQAQPMEVP